MDKKTELVKNTLILLNRVDIKGSEVPGYIAIVQWLQGMVDPADLVDTTKDSTSEEEK